MKIRGREYASYEEYLDEVQEYRLEEMKEGREMRDEEKEVIEDED